jgi:hypothetical protein
MTNLRLLGRDEIPDGHITLSAGGCKTALTCLRLSSGDNSGDLRACLRAFVSDEGSNAKVAVVGL